MPKINILDRETAELIAAGEVIERPASVVKELVENAIDAGAAAITVEIQNGGVRLIRVTDNGCGIERDEVPKAFLRHATSKVAGPADLDRIGTLGFRGEALASICAVSHVELLTRSAGEEIGTSYTLSGEYAGVLCEAGCPVGTTITVRDLFYNVPARMKFLKKDSTEGAAIATLMDRLALSHPEIAFRLIREKEMRLNTPGSGDLLAAIYAVYGNEFGRSLVPVECESGPFRISGYLVRPECCRPSRSMEHFFINHRYVKSTTMMAAVEESYRNHLMVGKFPGCVIDLTLDPAEVDVNVHPAKLEVKLSDERSVFDAVYNACRGALAQIQRTVPVQDVGGKRFGEFTLHNRPTEGTQTRMTAEEYRAFAQKTEAPDRSFAFTGIAKAAKKWDKEPASSMLHSESVEQSYRQSLPPKGTLYGAVEKEGCDFAFTQPRKWEPTAAAVAENPACAEKTAALSSNKGCAEIANYREDVREGNPPFTDEKENSFTLIGEVFATYLLVEAGDELLLIDKHAAHERILFNRLKRQHRVNAVERQFLLTPLTVMLSKELYDAAVDHIESFDRLGFAAEDFGDGCIRIREIPAILGTDNINDLIIELTERFAHAGGDESALFDELYHSVACKAAIKGNRPSGTLEQQELLRLLQEDPTVRNCPHGRPVAVTITRRELEKMFGRIV